MKLCSVYHNNVSILFPVETVLLVAFLRFSFKLYQARSRILKTETTRLSRLLDGRADVEDLARDFQPWTWRKPSDDLDSWHRGRGLGRFLQTHVQNQTLFRMKDMTNNLTMDVFGRVVP